MAKRRSDGRGPFFAPIGGTNSAPLPTSTRSIDRLTVGIKLVWHAAEILHPVGFSPNDQDEIVGDSYPKSLPFYWSQATGIILLQSLTAGRRDNNPATGAGQSGNGVDIVQSAGGAYHITNSGTIVGYVINPAKAFHAVIWADRNSAPQDLGTLAGGTNSYATCINNVGQVVGYADVQ